MQKEETRPRQSKEWGIVCQCQCDDVIVTHVGEKLTKVRSTGEWRCWALVGRGGVWQAESRGRAGWGVYLGSPSEQLGQLLVHRGALRVGLGGRVG